MSTTPLPPPRGQFRRRMLFLHRWLGIVVGLYFAVLGITGSILVFGREIDRALNPGLLSVAPQGQYRPLSEIVANFRRAYPDAPMSYVNYPLPPDGVFNIRSGPSSASQLYVYFNPYTGEIIGDRTRIGSLYGFLCYLHFYLLVGQIGWTINGYGALLTLMLVLLGVWLWWPAKKAGAAVWKARFWVKTTAGRSKTLFDLHNAVGIYTLVFAVLFCVTTLVFAFPEPSRRVLYALTRSPADATFRLTPPSGAVSLPLDRLVAAADAAIEGRILRVSFPQRPSDPLMVRKEWDDWNRTRNHAMIAVDPYTGRVLDVYDSRQVTSLGRVLAQWAVPLHFGLWGGMTTRVLYVLLGLAPAIGLFTGFWRWRIRTTAERKSREKLRQLAQVRPAPAAGAATRKNLDWQSS
ncbi:MAG: PepSY-associated TM helix domain-containing protein [Vicinamibacterales bacterium]